MNLSAPANRSPASLSRGRCKNSQTAIWRRAHNRIMDINRFTEKLQEGVRSAQSKAVRYGHQQIDVEHLLAALLEQEGGLAPSILAKAGLQVDPLTKRLEAELDRLPKVSGPSGGPDQIYVSGRLNKLLVN